MFKLTLSLMFVIFLTDVCYARITITKLEITTDPDYLKVEHCFSKKDDGKSYISATSEVLQEIKDEIIIHGNISFMNDGKLEPLSKIFPINFCKYLDGTNKNAILQLTWGELTKFGNLPTACPIQKGTYTVKDFYPNEKLIPVLLPGGEYHIEIYADLVKDEKPISQMYHVQAWGTIV